MKETFT